MLCKVGALHASYRGQGNPVAHIPNGPDARDITLAEVIHLHTTLLIQLHAQLQVQEKCAVSVDHLACFEIVRRAACAR